MIQPSPIHSLDRRLLLLVFGLTAVLLPGALLALSQRATAEPATLPSAGSYTSYLPIASWPGPITLRHVGTAPNTTGISQNNGGVYASQREGLVLRLDNGEVALDIRDQIDYGNLLSFRVTEELIYVIYKTSVDLRLSRFPLGDQTATSADEDRLMTLTIFPDGIHHGADLTFGPDGYLYVSIGDSAVQGDPDRHAQDLSLLFGSLLRLDVTDAGLPPDCDPNGRYTIPPDNPFVDGPGGACDELWLIGLRQPWRFSFDRNSGDLWIGDVGYNSREEVNFVPAGHPGGLNFGWSCYEGTLPFNLDGCDGEFEPPVYEYSHTGERCMITGGFVYHGPDIPQINGRYLYADFCSGEILTLDDQFQSSFLTWVPGAAWGTFGEGPSGELYIADFYSGYIYRIEE